MKRPLCTPGERYRDDVVEQGPRRPVTLGGGEKVVDRTSPGDRVRRALAGRADVQLVMKTRCLEIKVDGDDALIEKREVPCGIGQQKAAASASLIGVEGERLHDQPIGKGAP